MRDAAAAPPLRIRVPGTQAGIREAVAAFDAFCAAYPPGRDALSAAHVALDEVLVNIVGHAFAGRDGGSIELGADLDATSLVITVTDDGPAYDPLQEPAPNTTLPLEARQPGGLGIHLVKHLMQQVQYSRQDDRNRLVLVRLLSGAPGGPGED
jgi:serine/threonine-protein kinase RsbW